MAARTNDTAIAPDASLLAFPLDYSETGHTWRCPITRYVIPKDSLRNLHRRKAILELAESDEAFQAVLWGACRDSFLVWLNLFGWTYRQHAVAEDGVSKPVEHATVAFITWPAQDAAATEIIHAINTGQDILLDKSRDQGATWLCLAVLVWLWLFQPDSAMKILSRKEEEVDQGVPNPDTLMWKVRFLVEHLPAWMQPSIDSSYMHYYNKSSKSTIDGESTNKHAGRGGRRKVILLDECSAYDNLEAIEASTHRAATCRIYNATPVGPSHYSELRFSGKIKVVVLGFWNHPEQGHGRYMTEEKGRKLWTSPFREREKARLSARVIAQNLDIDHQNAGSMFFDSAVLATQAATFAVRPPVATLNLMPKVSGDDLDAGIRRGDLAKWNWGASNRGKLTLWCPLLRDAKNRLRPRQDHTYVIGGDIAWGTGAANSVLCIIDKDTGEQVGEWTCANTDPAAFARVAAMLGWWFGGPNGQALLSWETNGGGEVFTRAITRLGYPWLYTDVTRGTRIETPKDRLGWHSSGGINGSKIGVLGLLRDALSMQHVKVRSPETLRELGTYVFYKSASGSAGVGPKRLEEESADARATHGDRAIALAVAWEASLRCDSIRPKRRKPQPLTMAWVAEQERAEREATRRREEGWKRPAGADEEEEGVTAAYDEDD